MRCPSCRVKLEKGPAAYVLGAAGYKVSVGDKLPPTVTCPSCGAAIPTQRMLDGDFDPPPGPFCRFLSFMGRMFR